MISGIRSCYRNIVGLLWRKQKNIWYGAEPMLIEAGIRKLRRHHVERLS